MSTNNKPWVLGLRASHNGAACLLQGDRIVAAVQEERLVGKKRARLHGARPSLAVQYCIDRAGSLPRISIWLSSVHRRMFIGCAFRSSRTRRTGIRGRTRGARPTHRHVPDLSE
jgi:predicted NodU family carbamoyl transferase